MSKNTERKNQTNLTIKLSKSVQLFTIKDLWKINPHFKKMITLRVKLTQNIVDGKVVELGNLTGGKGRPQKIFALTPVTEEVIKMAKERNVNFVANYTSFIGKSEVEMAVVSPVTNIISGTTNPVVV